MSLLSTAALALIDVIVFSPSFLIHSFSSFFFLSLLSTSFPSFLPCLLPSVPQSVFIAHEFEPEGKGGERILDAARQFQDNVLYYVCSQQGYIRLSKQVMTQVHVVQEQCQMQSNKAYNTHLNAESSFKRSRVPSDNPCDIVVKTKQTKTKNKQNQTNKQNRRG